MNKTLIDRHLCGDTSVGRGDGLESPHCSHFCPGNASQAIPSSGKSSHHCLLANLKKKTISGKICVSLQVLLLFWHWDRGSALGVVYLRTCPPKMASSRQGIVNRVTIYCFIFPFSVPGNRIIYFFKRTRSFWPEIIDRQMPLLSPTGIRFVLFQPCCHTETVSHILSHML